MTTRSSKSSRSSIRKKSRSRSSSCLPDPALPLSKADAAALDDFCASFACDDISFEHWEEVQATLTLTIPLWLSPAEAAAGVTRSVIFSRTVRPAGEAAPRREAATCVVVIPPQSQERATIVLKGQGDRAEDLCGDLIVSLRIRSR